MLTEKDHQDILSELNKILMRLNPATDGGVILQGKHDLDNALQILAYAKNFLKKKMEKMELQDPLTQKYLLDYFHGYVNISSVKGECRQRLGLIGKLEDPNNRGNDGSGKQHWIPNCYTKHFSDENNNLSWWTYENITAGLNKPINPNGPFRELEDNKGNHYPHNTELILAEFETDYGVVMDRDRYNLSCPWNHMVVSLFFYLLSVRTLEQKQNAFRPFRELINNDFSGADVYMQNHMIVLIEIKSLLSFINKDITTFITQDPATRYEVVGLCEFIVAPYDLKHLIVIKQGFTKDMFKEEPEMDWHQLLLEFLQTKMFATTTYEDKYIYTHPKTSPFRLMTAEFAERNPLPNMI